VYCKSKLKDCSTLYLKIVMECRRSCSLARVSCTGMAVMDAGKRKGEGQARDCHHTMGDRVSLPQDK